MNKIFISIACFMDNDIVNTIDNCLKQAKYPEHLTFGICYQCNLSNKDILHKYRNDKRFTIETISWKKALGPAYARAIIYDMFKDEDYFLQIDCHSRFFNNWDIDIINYFEKCKKEYPKVVISNYPININNMKNTVELNRIGHISSVRCIDKNFGIKTHGRFININSKPIPSFGISAAFLFIDKKAYNDVPFDKEIYGGLQFEEQTVLAARYWTNGYNIYQMNKHIIATEYLTNVNRFNERPTIPNYLKNESFNRLCDMMKLTNNNTKQNNCSLGKIRTIEEYYEFIKVRKLVNKTFPYNTLQYKKKILIMVLSSFGIYQDMLDTARETWAKNLPPNIEICFYFGKKDNYLSDKTKNEIQLDVGDGRNDILKKTLMAFEVSLNKKYDYLLRLCACSYIDIQKLNIFVNNLEERNVFSGPINKLTEKAAESLNEDRLSFLVGANMLFSRDIIENLVANKNHPLIDYTLYGYKDDVCISRYINKNIISTENWIKQEWISLNDIVNDNNEEIYKENVKKIFSNKGYHYHYNFRTLNKEQILKFDKDYCG
jgi:hypothetical protein